MFCLNDVKLEEMNIGLSIASLISTVEVGVITFSRSTKSVGAGAKSLSDTVDSLPSACRMCAYVGVASVNCTSSTNGSFLLDRTKRRNKTGPGRDSHDGRVDPFDERR